MEQQPCCPCIAHAQCIACWEASSQNVLQPTTTFACPACRQPYDPADRVTFCPKPRVVVGGSGPLGLLGADPFTPPLGGGRYSESYVRHLLKVAVSSRLTDPMAEGLSVLLEHWCERKGATVSPSAMQDALVAACAEGHLVACEMLLMDRWAYCDYYGDGDGEDEGAGEGEEEGEDEVVQTLQRVQRGAHVTVEAVEAAKNGASRDGASRHALLRVLLEHATSLLEEHGWDTPRMLDVTQAREEALLALRGVCAEVGGCAGMEEGEGDGAEITS